MFRVNRMFWRSPGRMILWLIVLPFLAAVVTVNQERSGDWLWWLLAAFTIFVVLQSVVYLPRAWRAYRR